MIHQTNRTDPTVYLAICYVYSGTMEVVSLALLKPLETGDSHHRRSFKWVSLKLCKPSEDIILRSMIEPFPKYSLAKQPHRILAY